MFVLYNTCGMEQIRGNFHLKSLSCLTSHTWSMPFLYDVLAKTNGHSRTNCFRFQIDFYSQERLVTSKMAINEEL